jgi:hypothetical protein
MTLVGEELYWATSGGEDPQKLGPVVYITANNTSGSFSNGHTYQSIIDLIEKGVQVVIVYARATGTVAYYHFIEKTNSTYYFSSPRASGGYIYYCTLTSSKISFGSADVEKVYMNPNASNTTYYVTLKDTTGAGYLYRSTSIYANPSSGYLYAKSHATSSADYAEYYEWEDGNPNNEDRRGHFVTLSSGDKVRFATSKDDYILGVVSVSPAVVGNDYDTEWKGKYLTDVFGRILTEEIYYEEAMDAETGEIIPAHTEVCPILNPEYDESQEYISREKRKEWVPVGTHG